MRWFLPLTATIAVARLAELRWSRRHQSRFGERGGVVLPERLYPAMVLLHAGTLVAAPLEARYRRRVAPTALGMRRRSAWTALGLGSLAVATGLRIWALATLGESWTTRLTRFPPGHRRVVTTGPYRYIRHPNYVAVALELLSLPLAGGATVTACLASLGNALLLRRRIAAEERELAADPRWRAAMLPRPRFFPRLGGAAAVRS